MLHVDHFGEDDPSVAAIVLVHGFTQNTRCWGSFAQLLADRWPVLAVDAPGHGRSAHDEASLTEAGQLIVDVGLTGDYIGYSMGGRMLLHAALGSDRRLLQSLVLIGATPGIEDADERVARRALDHARAASLLTEGVPAFIDGWLAGPLFADLSDEQACRSARLDNRAEGMAASLRHCGTGSQEPLWDQLHAIEMPVLVIAGSDDVKFSDVGRRMVAAIGSNASFATVRGGHAVHLANPAGVADAVMAWRRSR